MPIPKATLQPLVDWCNRVPAAPVIKHVVDCALFGTKITDQTPLGAFRGFLTFFPPQKTRLSLFVADFYGTLRSLYPGDTSYANVALKLADPVIASVAITGGLLNTRIFETDLLDLEQAPAQPNLEIFFGTDEQAVHYEFHAFAGYEIAIPVIRAAVAGAGG